MEAVLTPLLFPNRPDRPTLWSGTPADTMPKLRVLDFGCGWGRCLGGMTYFSPHISRAIEYIGCERSNEELKHFSEDTGKLEQKLLGGRSFGDVLGGVKFSTWDEVRATGFNAFDYVYLVNVLHHIPTIEIPGLLEAFSSLLKDGGFLIVHDLSLELDQGSEAINYSFYCKESVFLGPEHLTALFAMASANTGRYRRIRRERHGKRYDLFTFVINFTGELSKAGHANDMFGDEYFSFSCDMPAALDHCLSDIQLSLAGATANDPWLAEYRELLDTSRVELARRFVLSPESLSVYAAERAIAQCRRS
jgi:SAM-dependent methyltransferase